MQNINEILARAAALRDETQLNSISPERAGGIMYDTLLALNDLWLQQGAALVISKIYASVAAMEADTAPVSDLTGQPLRAGQIVVIASSDSDNGSVYRYNGTEAPRWSLVGAIGNLEPVDSLDSDSTSLPLAAHQGKVLDGKISQLGQLQAQTFLYWGLNNKPQFKLKADNPTSVDITFPGVGFRIYNRNGVDVLGSVTTLNNLTINIPTANKLVLHSSTKAYEVVAVDATPTDDEVLLFSNTYQNAFDGLLAPYFYLSKIKYYDNSIDTYIYWQSNGVPIFDITGTTVNITFPNANFHIFRKDGGYVVKSSTVGKGQTFSVQTLKAMVFNPASNAIEIVTFGENYPDGCYLLLTNNMGKYFTGMLTPYMSGMKEYKAGLSAYFVYGEHPDFVANGTTLTIRFPSRTGSNLRIYSVNDGIDMTITDYIGSSFTLTSTQKLVLDLSDNTIKVVNGNVTGNFYDLLTNNGLIVTGLLAPFYTQSQNTIAHLYYNQAERIILQNLQKKNVTGTSESGLPPLILLHFSDIHENGANLQRIMDYHTMFADFFADILNTGDNINVGTDSYDFYTDVDGTENILTAIGNHDVSQGNSGVDIYNKEIAPFVANWGVVQPANAATLGLCYYYKDYAASKIRLIVLDNFAPDMSAQASWLADVLADAKTNDLCVVCAGHFPCPMDLIKESTFCSLDGGTQPNPMQSALIEAVSTFIAGGGKFACWITGHTHEDLFGTVTNHPEQVCITVSSASQSRNAGSAARILGTKSQDSFNVISIDENTHCLKVHKIGADRDRYLRHIGEMCYNYQTGTLVYND